MKQRRQKKILEIIEKNDVDTQSTLMELLLKSGFNATQATLSRDIRELRLIKILGKNGTYKYSVPTKEKNTTTESKLRSIFIDTIISVDYVSSTVVLKCHTGMANAACAALDNMNIKDVVGSIAGDDTIFVLLRNDQAAIEFVEEIKLIIKD